jgi:hypothetical protein
MSTKVADMVEAIARRLKEIEAEKQGALSAPGEYPDSLYGISGALPSDQPQQCRECTQYRTSTQPCVCGIAQCPLGLAPF